MFCFIIYSLGFIFIYGIYAFAIHGWFKVDTRFTNESSNVVEVTPIVRGYTNYSIMDKNGLFPFDWYHSYEAVHLEPGKTAKFTWDWDDVVLDGFALRISKDKMKYMKIDHSSKNECCYLPKQTNYYFSDETQLTGLPSALAKSSFSKKGRWLSYRVNILIAALWFVLGIPLVALFRKSFVRKKTALIAF